MDEASLTNLLSRVSSGEATVQEATEALRNLPYEDLGFARVDHHRTLRQGFPEVIFCLGKTPGQTAGIFRALAERGDNVLATRATLEHYEAVRSVSPEAEWHEEARAIRLLQTKPDDSPGYVAVVTAGTADIPVAEEAAVTAETLGDRVERAYDVGVAGLHRLLGVRDMICSAGAIIVAAGMEGALPSVVAGLVGVPVIAVPTSVGYGSSFEGLAALLGMLNSCANGVAVVNIDNGFGAACFAHMILNGRAG